MNSTRKSDANSATGTRWHPSNCSTVPWKGLTRQFPEASKSATDGDGKFRFRLYVARDTANSALAIANLYALCRAHLPNQHTIEVVDVLLEPKRALADRVYMTPTLLKLAPSPIRRIVGTLSETQTVLQVLGLEALAACTRDNHQFGAPRASQTATG